MKTLQYAKSLALCQSLEFIPAVLYKQQSSRHSLTLIRHTSSTTSIVVYLCSCNLGSYSRVQVYMELEMSHLLLCLVTISSVCGQNSLSEADSQELLDAHNRFRSMVDPPATNMRRMVSTINAALSCYQSRILY